MELLKPRIFWQFLKFVFAGFDRHHGLENAKSLTYTSLFAVVPLLTLMVAVLSIFPSFKVFGQQIEDLLFSHLLPSSSQDLQVYITEFSTQAKKLTWVGAMILLATSYFMLVNIERNFNYIWGVDESRKGLVSFLLYWSVLSLGPLLLGVGFAISSYITSLEMFETLNQVSESMGVDSLLLGVFPLVLTTLAFTLLYCAVPNCSVAIKHALVGGVVVALAFALAKELFTLFIAKASYELVYGTFAAVPILLMWIYLCWVVILFGANLVRAIPLFQADRETRAFPPLLLLLALLHLFWERHRQGRTVRVEELLAMHWPYGDYSCEGLLQLLDEHNLIRLCGHNEYLLSQDLAALTLWELHHSLAWRLPALDMLPHEVPEELVHHLPFYTALRERLEVMERQGKAQMNLNLTDLFRPREESHCQPPKI